jgi:hypothetical protein
MPRFGYQGPVQILYTEGALALISPYKPDLVAAVKSLPMADRRWEPVRKVWLVDPKHIDQLISWVDAYTGQKVASPLPFTGGASGETVTQVLALRYLGGCKERDDGSVSAFGLVGHEWSAIFSERVLREWFEGIDFDDLAQTKTQKRPLVETYYTILGIKKAAALDEIKTAFRRMAMQWHPDHCKEPDANERFIQIKSAFDALSNPNKKARYDLGLELQKKYDQETRRKELSDIRKTLSVQSTYRAPLRCGMVMVEGLEKLGRIEVTKILVWQDWMVNGLTLVTSWPAGATEPIEEWL